ncbi:hypothetical protein GQ600_16353 [Phytophthora cactorum]|nr:hypothetical protein GQ600_16353 [Phytophthora cactorum]
MPAALEVRVAGEVTEELAAKYDVHRATLWRWVKAEARNNEGQGTKRKKKVMSTSFRVVYGFAKEQSNGYVQ